MRGLRDRARRDHAADVLVQQSVRRVPVVQRSGSRMSVDPDLVVPEPYRSIHSGAIHPWRDATSSWHRTMLRSVARHLKVDLEAPWKSLPARARKAMLYGTDQEIEYKWEGKRSTGTYRAPFDGVIPSLEKRHRQTDNERTRAQIERYMRRIECPECEGTRLRPESRAVRLQGKGISEVSSLQVDEARSFLAGAPAQQAEPRHRRRRPQGDRRAAGLPGERGGGLPLAGPERQDALRRGGAAHPTGHAARFQPGGRPLHPGRAVHRGCTTATTRSCWRACCASAISATRSSSWSTTRRRCWPPITSWTWAPGRAGTAETSWRRERPSR